MALTLITYMKFNPPTQSGIVCPSTLNGPVAIAIPAGDIDTIDASTTRNPDTQIAATRPKLNRLGAGTLLVASLVYDDGLTPSTDPVVKVFGKTGTDRWRVIPTIAGTLNATLVTATTTDAWDGTYYATPFDFEDISWDCYGVEEVVFAVETALAGAGTTSTAYVEALFI